MALNNLRSKVIELRNEGLAKDKILISLVNKVKEDEASFKAQAKIQKNEIEDLRKQLAEAKEKCALAEANREISEYWKNYIEKTVEELRASKERCFEKSLGCVECWGESEDATLRLMPSPTSLDRRRQDDGQTYPSPDMAPDEDL
jgi:septal ring factor EnvC (AmiA/AmiB activator)